MRSEDCPTRDCLKHESQGGPNGIRPAATAELAALNWLSSSDRPEQASGVASDDGVGSYVSSDDTARPDDRILSDGHAAENGCAGTDRGTLLDNRPLDFPVFLRLKLTVQRGRTRVRIVDEGYAVTDKNVVFDGHAFAHEGVTRNLAAAADRGVLLNL